MNWKLLSVKCMSLSVVLSIFSIISQTSCAQDVVRIPQAQEAEQGLSTGSSREAPAKAVRAFRPRQNYHTLQYLEKLAEFAFYQTVRHPLPAKTRRYPFFEKENKLSSVSVGNTSTGYTINGRAMSVPSLTYRVLPVQYERPLRYGTEELIELLEYTARKMAKAYPGSVMYLGNFGAIEGGDIPYSVSHNSGRDADIAYYSIDDPGVPPYPNNLLHWKKNLRSKEDGGVRKFDVAKNAALVKTFLSHPKVKVQFMFMAKHLRSAIIKYFREQGESEEFITYVSEVIQEQAAHGDHVHIRVYCSKEDICGGCIDRSIIHPGIEDPAAIREKCVEQYYQKVRSKKVSAEDRAVAIRRLGLLNALEQSPETILGNLKSSDAVVRAAAADVAVSIPGASTALVKALGTESDGEVRCALISSLSAKHDVESYNALIPSVGTDSEYVCPDGRTTLSMLIDALQYSGRMDAFDALLARYAVSSEGDSREQLLSAMQLVSNVVLPDKISSFEESVEFWKAWQSKWHDKKHAEWLVSGFRAAGYAVPNLEKSSIPLLLDAIEGPRPVSVNAQLELMRLSGNRSDSLSWSTSDALWYWTRYFKKRQKKYKINLSDRDEHGRKL